MGRRKRKEMHMRKRKMEEALYLINKCSVPVHLAAKRVGLSQGLLRRITKTNVDLAEDPFKRKSQCSRF
jgi:hypothetical protein